MLAACIERKGRISIPDEERGKPADGKRKRKGGSPLYITTLGKERRQMTLQRPRFVNWKRKESSEGKRGRPSKNSWVCTSKDVKISKSIKVLVDVPESEGGGGGNGEKGGGKKGV